jgi:cytochrome c-type biogenesis protein
VGADGRAAYVGCSGSAPPALHNCGVPALLALGSRFDDVSVYAYLAAFGGGIISFLSPCVLPLVPAYLSMVTGLDLATLQDGARAQQRQVIRTTSLFVAGFGAVFVLLGLSVSSAGRLLRDHQDMLTRISGTVMVAMGLFLLGSLFLRAPWLYQEKRFHPQLGRFGDAAPVVAGVAFGFGWSPCIGPILGSILAIAGTQDRVWAGATLLVAYTLGLGLPFLVTGLALGRVSGALAWVKRHFPLLVGTAAVILIGFGVVLMFDQLSRVTAEMQQALDGTPFEWLVNLG